MGHKSIATADDCMPPMDPMVTVVCHTPLKKQVNAPNVTSLIEEGVVEKASLDY